MKRKISHLAIVLSSISILSLGSALSLWNSQALGNEINQAQAGAPSTSSSSKNSTQSKQQIGKENIKKIRKDLKKNLTDVGPVVRDTFFPRKGLRFIGLPVRSYEIGSEITFSGSIDSMYSSISQDENFRTMGLNSSVASSCTDQERCHGQQSAFTTYAKLKIGATRVELDKEYGIYYKLNVNTSPESTNSDIVYIFLQNKHGRLEIGSNFGVGALMKVDAIGLARATGGVVGSVTDWFSGRICYDSGDSNKTNMKELFTKAPNMAYVADQTGKANKISYLSPRIHGWNFGLSFIPNTNYKGAFYDSNTVKTSGYKNVFEGVVKYSNKIKDSVIFETSASFEIGGSKNYLYQEKTDGSDIAHTKDLYPLRAWEVGAKLGYNGFAIIGSYGDSGKSGMFKDDLANDVGKLVNNMKKQNRFWTAGLGYAHDKFGVSLTYLGSHTAGKIASWTRTVDDDNTVTTFPGYCTGAGVCTVEGTSGGYNKTQIWSIGADYKIAPGLMPYIEFSRFNFKSPLTQLKTNSGHVMVIGVKMSF
jgi:outer membrane protein OmpU